MLIKLGSIIQNPIFWLVIIVLVGLKARLYMIDRPIADWHAWRQADTAAVARNFWQEGFNPLLPRYDDMSGVAENPVPNPNRFRFVEFPIYPSLVYAAYLINGGVDVKLARGVAAAFSLGSIILVYLITKRYFGVTTALLAGLLFAILPFNVYFSRTVLPEASLVFFCLGMFYFIDRWIKENRLGLYAGSLIFTTAAFLTKPMAIFYLMPLVYSYLKQEQRWWPIPRRYLYLFIPSLIPLIAWRIWIMQHPEGIPASNWLLNGTGIRFRPAFFRWILGDRFGREILSVAGTFLLLIGLLVKPFPKESWLLHLLALSSFLFLIVFATGNVTHDYYQTLIIPALVIFVARGVVLLLKGIPNFIARLWTIPLALLLLVLTIYLTWYEVKGLYQINNGAIIRAGEAADKILPKDAIVLAPYQGDTSLLYHVNRPGWPVTALPIEELIEKYGVSHYISVSRDSKTDWVMRRFQVLVDHKDYVIADLTKVNPVHDQLADPEP